MPELPMKEREKTEQIEVWGKDKKRERLGGGGVLEGCRQDGMGEDEGMEEQSTEEEME